MFLFFFYFICFYSSLGSGFQIQLEHYPSGYPHFDGPKLAER